MNSNAYNNIAGELKTCFSNNSFLRILLPLDVVLIAGALVVFFLSSLLGINIGNLLPAIAYYAFLLGILLAYANLHHIFVYSGLFAYAGVFLLTFLRFLIWHGHFNWYDLMKILVFGWLGYIAFKQNSSSTA